MTHRNRGGEVATVDVRHAPGTDVPQVGGRTEADRSIAPLRIRLEKPDSGRGRGPPLTLAFGCPKIRRFSLLFA